MPLIFASSTSGFIKRVAGNWSRISRSGCRTDGVAPPAQESGFLQDVDPGGPQGPMSILLSTIAVPNRNQEPEPHDNEQRQYYGDRRVGGDGEAKWDFELERIALQVR